MELKQILNEIKKQNAQLSWEGTFEEYFNMVVKEPDIARLSHQRVYDAILDAGTTTNRLGLKGYSLFADELFGLERGISQVVEYFGAAARGLDTRKRILLLMGPPASGKTTLANLLKKGIETYTRTDKGALYAIEGCPMQEEPLHLIPPEFRAELKQKYGLSITGSLCPHCRWMLKDVYHGEIDKVKVTRVVLSEEMGIGVGTFVATDPGSQDLARLTGDVGSEIVGEDRIENFGRTFQLNGELNVANRGIMEFIEMFKLDERFLAVLLVLTEEQKIKAPGSGTIYADEAIIAHSNEAEYESMVSDKKTEGLQDRIMVVRIPYNLRVSEEARIYKKLLAKVDLKGTHIAPLSLPVASIFAVLSRLQPSERFGMSLVKKMRLYDGQFVERFSLKDVQELQDESPREGMIGISPRFVINQISRAVSRSGVNCLDPIDLLQTLWEGLEQSTTLAREEQKRLYTLFQDTRREYDELAKRDLQKAFVENFDHVANSMIREYIEGIKAYMANPDGHKKQIGIQSNEDGRNERMMRSLERLIDVQDYDVESFRHDIYRKVEPLQKAGLPVDYRMDARLEEATIRKLCPDLRQVARVINGEAPSDAELTNNKKQVIRRLIEERGYEIECAQRLVKHVDRLLNSNNRSRSSLPKALRWLQG